MTDKEMIEFARYVKNHVGTSDSNTAPLHGILDAYGLTGPEREEMINELHKIGAVKSTQIDSMIHLDKLPG